MSQPTFGVLARGVYTNQEQLRATRAAISENSARMAFHQAKFTVTGMGYTAMTRPMMFDCIFSQPPTLSMGIVLDKFPNDATLRYPLCNVGVWKWVTEKSPAAKTKITNAQNALNEFKTISGGTHLPEYADAKASLAATQADEDDLLWTGAYPYFHVDIQPVIRDAIMPNVRVQITFDLIWMGVAYKDLGKNIMDELHNDPSLDPLTDDSDSLDMSGDPGA